MRRGRWSVSIRVILGLCLLAGQGLGQTATHPATQATTPAAEPPAFCFAAIADPHIEKIETAENLRRFLFTMQGQDVDFLVILGDICSYKPDLLEQVGRIIERSPLKVYPVPGNKDNDYGKHPEWYTAALGPSYSAFDHKGWRFILYDTFDPPPAEWLERQLGPPDARTPVLFCAHAPPDPRALTNREPYSELGQDPDVKAALMGHWHRRTTGHFGTLTFEVLKDCFLRGKESPGTYYIISCFASGRINIRECSVADLKLAEPPDAVPTVAIRMPPDGQVLRNRTTFRGTAADDKGVRELEYSIDWGAWQVAHGTGDWNFALDTRSLTDGNHLFRMRAIDTAGQASTRLAQVIETTDNYQASDRIFRFRQGRDGYTGCRDATVRRSNARPAQDGAHSPTDLHCCFAKKGQDQFCEFYIRFDLAGSRIPADARIRRVSLTLYSNRQEGVDSDGRLCRYFVGLPQQDWDSSMTFQTRPADPGWTGEPKPDPAMTGTWPGLPWWYLDTLPQPVVIGLTPIKDTVRRWLREPAGNRGLVFSPGAGPGYSMSARGSRCSDWRFRPMLEIELDAGPTE